MAESSNPATPSRFNMGAQRFSSFMPEDDGYRPPTLTAQGREDVERLRAKVRKHNPGYIYTNGVSLPSQLPSVPELLDELASHVRSARSDHSIPNTPLPEVETSELAKAGFDWKAIADCAIEALETGSRRPLPLANDPAAAEIPGLSIIAAARASSVTAPTPEMPAEPEPETLPVETSDRGVDWHSSETACSETAATPADTAEPLAPEVGVPLAHAPENAVAETEVPEETLSPSGEPMAAGESTSEKVAPTLDQELPDSEAPEGAPDQAESWSEPEEHAATDAEEIELSEELPEQLPEELPAELSEHQPEDLLEQLPDDLSEELPEALPEELPVQPEDDELSEQTLAEEISAAEDLVGQRVYDDDVLESEGNDDELYVGDVEGEMAHWAVNPEESEEVLPLEPDQPAVTPDEVPAEVASETEPEAIPEQTALPEDAEVAEELPAAVLLEETEVNEPQIETELTLQDSASEEPVDAVSSELTEETPVEETEPAEIPETEIPEELPEMLNPAAATEETFAETDVDLVDLDLGELDDLELNLESAEIEMPEESGLDEQVEESADAGLAETAELADEIPAELSGDAQASQETALPGSEAIGMEEPDASPDSDWANQEEIDLGDFADSESEVPAELSVSMSDEMPEGDTAEENEGTEPAAADLPYLGENAEEMLAQANQAEAEGDEEELSFEIPQVQGDIPEAMQEGYPEWDPTESAEGVPGADEELFAAGYEDAEAEVEPVKQGFFSRLFSKRPKK